PRLPPHRATAGHALRRPRCRLPDRPAQLPQSTDRNARRCGMTLWLTRIQPDLSRRDARRDLASAVGMHHRLMALFPDNLGPAARRDLGVLFRIEDAPGSGTSRGAHILLQSRVRPDLDRLPAG